MNVPLRSRTLPCSSFKEVISSCSQVQLSSLHEAEQSILLLMCWSWTPKCIYYWALTIGQSPCLVGRCHDLIYSTQLLHIIILLHYWLGSWGLKRRGKFCRVTEPRLTPRSPDSSTRLPSALPYCELLSARPPALTLQPRLVLQEWQESKHVFINGLFLTYNPSKKDLVSVFNSESSSYLLTRLLN